MNFASSRNSSVYTPERVLASVTSLPALGGRSKVCEMCRGKGLTEGSRTESCISRLDRGGKVRSERSVKLKASVVAAVFRRSTVSLCLFYVFQPLMGSREAQKENAKHMIHFS